MTAFVLNMYTFKSKKYFFFSSVWQEHLFCNLHILKWHFGVVKKNILEVGEGRRVKNSLGESFLKL